MAKPKLTAEQQEEFVDREKLEGYVHIDTQFICMDSHGCNCQLFVFAPEKKPDRLYGFIYRESSEEGFYEDLKIYEIAAKEVVVKQYENIDGKNWSL